MFTRWDIDHQGKIAINDYFEGLLDEPRNKLADEIFRLLEFDDDQFMDFGQFALVTVTYSLFEVSVGVCVRLAGCFDFIQYTRRRMLLTGD